VPPDKLEKIAELVNAAPQVTHNYLRSDELNLWFTFTTRYPGELETFLARLKETGGLAEIYALDTEKLFKIKVDFRFSPP
jgi:DNA-binding Lrp family transcriptional regulator